MTTAALPANARYRSASPEQLARDVDYAWGVAREYRLALEAAGARLAGARLLEIGPGPTMGTSIGLAALGARVTVADPYLARWDDRFHRPFCQRLRTRIATEWPEADLSAIDRILAAGSFEAGIETIAAGAEALDALPEAAFDLALSNAVFEHVADVSRAVYHLARVSRPGCLHLHQIDFRDHNSFERPLEYLTLSARAFRRTFARQRGECGNRWRHTHFLRAFAAGGFDVEAFVSIDPAPPDYVDSIRRRLHRDFAALRDDELSVLGGQILARRGTGPAIQLAPGDARALPALPAPRASAGAPRSAPSGGRPCPAAEPTDAPGALLVLRSCRPVEFTAAVAQLRALFPGDRVVAMTHAAQAGTTREAGVDDVVDWPAGRFTARALSWPRWRRLRAPRYRAVVVPQMTWDEAGHLNLYVLALAIGAPRILTVSPETGVHEWSRLALARLVLRHWPVLARLHLEARWAALR